MHLKGEFESREKAKFIKLWKLRQIFDKAGYGFYNNEECYSLSCRVILLLQLLYIYSCTEEMADEMALLPCVGRVGVVIVDPVFARKLAMGFQVKRLMNYGIEALPGFMLVN